MAELIVKGKPLPIHFGMKAITEYFKRHNKDFHDVVASTETISSIETLIDITVMGLNEGARRAKSDTRYTQDDIWDMLDEDPNLILKVSELFVESIVPLTEKLGELGNVQPTAVKDPSA